MSSPTDAPKTIAKISGAKISGARNETPAKADLGPSDFDIRIASDGTWYHEGAPIRRLAIARLFATVLTRDEAGDYWLSTPAEKGRITVDDAPFVAVELTVENEGADQTLRFRTNLDHQVEVGADHPIRVAHDAHTGEPRPYVTVSNGLEALIARAAFFQLADMAQEWEGRIGVWSRGTFHPLDPNPSSAPVPVPVPVPGL